MDSIQTMDHKETNMNQSEIDALVRQQLPSWAMKRASGLEIGAQLPTRDGRITGNAHIVDIAQARKGTLGLRYLILTDAGNSFVMSEPEVIAQYYPPEWVADVHEIIKRFWREDLPLIKME